LRKNTSDNLKRRLIFKVVANQSEFCFKTQPDWPPKPFYLGHIWQKQNQICCAGQFGFF
jgi:hypothetical protein